MIKFGNYITVPYDSPISLNTVRPSIEEEFARMFDDKVGKMTVKAVQKVGIDIDKDKLISAIQQDKERYQEAYIRGVEDARTDVTVVSSNDVGKYFHELRMDNGWTMDEVAKDAGLSKSTIVRLETTSNTPSMYTIEQVAKIFGKRIAIVDE